MQLSLQSTCLIITINKFRGPDQPWDSPSPSHRGTHLAKLYALQAVNPTRDTKGQAAAVVPRCPAMAVSTEWPKLFPTLENIPFRFAVN